MKAIFKPVLVVTSTVLLTAFGVPAAAQTAGDIRDVAATPSTVARGQVLAELAQARASGQLPSGEIGTIVAATPSTRARADVLSELRFARANGLIPSGEVGFASGASVPVRPVADAR